MGCKTVFQEPGSTKLSRGGPRPLERSTAPITPIVRGPIQPLRRRGQYLLDLALDQSQTGAYMIVVDAFLFNQLATNITIHIHQYALLFKVVQFLRCEQTNSKKVQLNFKIQYFQKFMVPILFLNYSEPNGIQQVQF